ncbi:MAG: hypothetical protein HC893_17220 [Chloroflexaceae bacterium]|nr:hypothetical protein [Chloroflexaceae bacterium]NJL35268.1 hypothetical protein [Chloroflexaceae bacterium]NJO04725.1 hypothetical protein [Chloroflexaceae bacterium]
MRQKFARLMAVALMSLGLVLGAVAPQTEQPVEQTAFMQLYNGGPGGGSGSSGGG